MDLSGIDPVMGATVVELASELSKLVLRGTATAVRSKIASLKNEKDLGIVRNSYDEIINQLLAEREEALMIAQSYKTELERVIISDDDIEYLQQTISKVIDLLVKFQFIDVNSDNQAIKAKAESQMAAINSVKELINKDVLKTMQLLGFNYKAAIGEPLTELCADKIKNISKGKRYKK